MSSKKSKHLRPLAISVLPDAPSEAHEAPIDFELRVRDVTLHGNSSRESCWGMFERLPVDFQQEMLLKGSTPDIWGDTLWGMTKDSYAPANGLLRLHYHETPEKGVIRYYHSWDQDPGWLWQVDMVLEIIWDGVSHRLRRALPDRNIALPYYWGLLPLPAQTYLRVRGCSPEMFNAIVSELWQVGDQFPQTGIGHVSIEFPVNSESDFIKLESDGKKYWYPSTENLVISENGRRFVISALAELLPSIPYFQALGLACNLAIKAEMTLGATMLNPTAIIDADRCVQHMLENIRKYCV